MFAKGTGSHSQGDNAGICAFYFFSSCTRGRRCRFLHDVSEELCNAGSKSPRRDFCYFFLKGKCNDGEKCNRFHGEPPSFNGTIKKVCVYFSEGKCYRGKLCSYIHALPDNFSPVNITLNPLLSENINEVPKVVINASDDVQSMANVPKPCRFYRRGMCFFGDNCTNFHDKPLKDVEALLSDLRKDEALKEGNKINFPHESEKNSNNLSVALTTNNNADLINLKVPQDCSNSSNQKESNRREPSREASKELPIVTNYNSTKREELLNPSGDSSSKQKESDKILYSSSEKSHERSRDPCNSLKSKEFARATKSSLSYSKAVSRSSNSSEFPNEPNSSSKSKKFVRTLENSLKSKQYAGDTYNSSNISSFSKSKELFSEPKGSSEPKELVKISNSSSNTKERASDTYYSSSNIASSTKPKEFVRTLNSSLKECASNTYSSSNIASSKSEKCDKKLNYSSKSQEFARDTRSSNSRDLMRDPCNSSKSREFFRSKCIYRSTNFSNDCYVNTNSRESSKAVYSSKPRRCSRYRYADNNSMSSELARDADIPESRESPENADNSSREQYDSLRATERLRTTDYFRSNETEEMVNATERNSNSREVSKASYSSKQRTYCRYLYSENKLISDDSTRCTHIPKSRESLRTSQIFSKSKEQSENEDNSTRSIRQFRTTDNFRPNESEEVSNVADNYSDSNKEFKVERDSESETQFSVTNDFSRGTGARKRPSMTRKQSKSQRKSKNERKPSRVIYRSYPYFDKS